MQFLVLPPTPVLAPLVTGYWFVEDLANANQGQPIHTVPHTNAVLTVHLGRPNVDELGVGVPRVSLLGVQSRIRTWGSGGDCYFVMVMLSLPGLIRLFPGSGVDSCDNVLDLGALLGDKTVGNLKDDLTGAWRPDRIAERLDVWLVGRLGVTRRVAELERFSSAWLALRCTGRLDATAQTVGMSSRQLERWFRTHVGRTPRELICQNRVIASLRATQTGVGDPLAGFSDQAHQIRSWRRYLGVTPGRYARTTPSEVARLFCQEPNAASEVHYL